METLVKLVPLARDLWVYVAIDVALALLLLLQSVPLGMSLV